MDATLVAIGGNSLIDPSLPPTVENQFAVTARAMAPIAELIGRGEHLVLTHGNGPQVGFMQLRSHLARAEVHEVPLDSLVADTQGSLGYMIQRDLREQLRMKGYRQKVATVVTEVRVDPEDPALDHPDKPVGKFYSAIEADELQAERGWQMVEDSKRGYRRVVPSPKPLQIVQLDQIRVLVDAGITVICCGGGGIPVVRNPDGCITGLEAVIDKDRTSALLAARLGARRMLITTSIDAVYRNFATDGQLRLPEVTVTELQALADAGHFAPGSMSPKVEAAIWFLEQGGDVVTICHPSSLVEAFEGRAGTRIRPG